MRQRQSGERSQRRETTPKSRHLLGVVLFEDTVLNTDKVFKGGKHKGESISSPNVSAGYLRFLFWMCDFEHSADEMILEELYRRGEPVSDSMNNQKSRDEAWDAKQKERVKGYRTKQSSPPPRQSDLTQASRELMQEIVVAGRKALAKINHPDVGGNAEKMKQINVIADRMLAMIGNMK